METILKILLMFTLSSLTCILIAYGIRLINRKRHLPGLSIFAWLAFPYMSTIISAGILDFGLGLKAPIPMWVIFVNVVIVVLIMRRVIGPY